MKKILAIFLAISMLFCLASCGESESNSRDESKSSKKDQKTCENNIKMIINNADNYLASNNEAITIEKLASMFDDGEIPECPLGGKYLIQINEDGSTIVECPNCDKDGHKPSNSNKVDVKNEANSTTEMEIVNDEWKKAYISYLYKIIGQMENVEYAGFSLVYIDNDNIPELVISDGDFHAASADVYTYSNSQVIQLFDNVGSYGEFGYVQRSGIILFSYGGMGYFSYEIYEMNGTRCTLLHTLSNNEAAIPEDETPTYTIDDKNCSKQEYEKMMNQYYANNVLSTYDNKMDLTLSNIDAIANY